MNPNKPVQAGNHPVEKPRRQVPHEQIAQRAEKIWRDRNCLAGSDEAIWFEAENQIQSEAESQPVSGTPSRPYTDEPAQPVRPQTKSRDPADMAAQTRSATERKSGPAAAPKGNKSLRSQ